MEDVLCVLEKEIMNRIKIKILGEGFINNKSVIDKINEVLKNGKNDDTDDNSDDNDSEEED